MGKKSKQKLEIALHFQPKFYTISAQRIENTSTKSLVDLWNHLTF